MSNVTRDLESATYRAAGRNNPPPLHVRADHYQADWFPYRRPYVAPAHEGPIMVTIPSLPADVYGEDPTDPARCHSARMPTPGLVGRLDVRAGKAPNVTAGGVRR